MSEPSREEVEALDKEFRFLSDLADECLRSGQEYGKGRSNGIRETIVAVQHALEAAAKVRQKGERVVWVNDTPNKVVIACHRQPVCMWDGLEPLEELVIRPIGGKEEKSE